MISATRNKVKWESGEGKGGGITPLILGNSGFLFYFIFGVGFVHRPKKPPRGGGLSQWLSRHGSNSDEIRHHVRGSKVFGGKMR
jgi:hypothetical protein